MIQNIALFILGVFLFNFGQGTGGLVGSLIQPAGLVSILWSGWSLYKIFCQGKNLYQVAFQKMFPHSSINIFMERQESQLTQINKRCT